MAAVVTSLTTMKLGRVVPRVLTSPEDCRLGEVGIVPTTRISLGGDQIDLVIRRARAAKLPVLKLPLTSVATDLESAVPARPSHNRLTLRRKAV